MIAEQLRLVLGDEENAAWLQRAIDAHVRTGASLDESLTLAGNGPSRSPRWRILDREQARLLSEALWLLDGNKARLAREIAVYKRRLAPIYGGKEPPADWPPLRRLIHAAARLKQLPDTAYGIGLLVGRN
ncbi:MAG: hypothetical protein IT468_01640 [Rhodocyclaceae bacterium]|nr:hypothetical protein [Rhodocyclaceae bacterium]